MDTAHDVTVRMSDGSECIVRKCRDELRDDTWPEFANEIRFYPGQTVRARPAVWRKAKWLTGARATAQGSTGTVIAVKPASINVQWVSDILMEPNYQANTRCSPAELSVIDIWPETHFSVNDRVMYNEQCAEIIRTDTVVSIRWHDGTESHSLSARSLKPWSSLLDNDFLPNDYVLSRGSPRLAYVLSVNQRQRTATIKFLSILCEDLTGQIEQDSGEATDNRIERAEGETATVPVYELVAHRHLELSLGGLVLRIPGPQETAEDCVPVPGTVGMVKDFIDGKTVIVWANDTSSTVTVDCILNMDSDAAHPEDDYEDENSDFDGETDNAQQNGAEANRQVHVQRVRLPQNEAAEQRTNSNSFPAAWLQPSHWTAGARRTQQNANENENEGEDDEEEDEDADKDDEDDEDEEDDEEDEEYEDDGEYDDEDEEDDEEEEEEVEDEDEEEVPELVEITPTPDAIIPPPNTSQAADHVAPETNTRTTPAPASTTTTAAAMTTTGSDVPVDLNTVAITSPDAASAAAFSSFSTLDTPPTDHNYILHAPQGVAAPSTFLLRRLNTEFRSLRSDLPAGVHVITYDSRMDLLRVAIVGPEETPYASFLFFFDVYIPTTYPQVPPSFHYHARGLRLHPNLYIEGRVCLSLLNTWNGKGTQLWNSKQSNLLQVLVSLQGLVLGQSDPYYLEAGYEKQKGTRLGAFNAALYNETALLYTLQVNTSLIHRHSVDWTWLIRSHLCITIHSPTHHTTETDCASA